MSKLVVTNEFQKHQNVATNLDDCGTNEREEIIAHPATHPDVKRYAECRQLVESYRLAGDKRAVRLEQKMEHLYAVIPARLRWRNKD